MKRSADTSVVDSFSSLSDDEGTGISLTNGSRVAVVGGGPSGSFFAFFLLKMATAIDLDIEVDINALERFLGDWAVNNSLSLPRLKDDSCEEWIGVVGAGPSGLSFAYQLARRGYRVTVYDA